MSTAAEITENSTSKMIIMPTNYRRKGNCSRATWTEVMLKMAMQAVRSGNMGVNEASREFKVPYTTLRRRLVRGDTKKKSLGSPSVLGLENERKIVEGCLTVGITCTFSW
ncbi:uncharacterized protein LOC115885482 [Sitophilus oryzae]|uniref:Uncharacterized protein LOC115885482 n=1 Tax=Sitophilus oryzae TaxID=7048 RepID=A0A6J2Y9Y5_SITOR|nr:uncharacterized protein LOC115885482 [Sitophilus oryzae]